MEHVTVTCACGRKMVPHATRGPNAFRCGCRGGVQIEFSATNHVDTRKPACVATKCLGTVVNDLVVPLCGKHRDRMVLALAPDVYTEYHDTNPVKLAEEHQRAFGSDARVFKPPPGRYGPEEPGYLVTYPSNEKPGFLRRHYPVVYFIIVGDQVKIGTTSNIDERLETFVPPGAEVHVVPGSYAEERRYHDRFKAERVGRTEWFRLSVRLRAAIDELVATGIAKPRTTLRRDWSERRPK